MFATAHETARIHRLTVAAYRRMGEVGILGPELRTELVDGEIVEMTPIGATHGGTVKLLSNLLKEAVGTAATLSVQDPVELSEHSELQPDIMLLQPRADYYRSAHPKPEDVLLAIEVADTTLRYDRDVKLPLYAKAGIREAWLVNLSARELSVYRGASATGYEHVTVVDALKAVHVPLTTARVIDLAGLFESPPTPRSP
jgi:Uma2 family endonuclease